jgi:phenylpyruvate tautomerase PptA (4-oxalocrotonate tautomerase family)
VAGSCATRVGHDATPADELVRTVNALVGAFKIPEWDRAVVLQLYPANRRIVSTAPSERLTRIGIIGIAARLLAAKRALFNAIADNLDAIGVPRSETRIRLIEPPAESWGVNGGQLASGVDLGFVIQV